MPLPLGLKFISRGPGGIQYLDLLPRFGQLAKKLVFSQPLSPWTLEELSLPAFAPAFRV